jgi:tRNA threonylcarbamoyladenosine biosynthesis protein TsaB
MALNSRVIVQDGKTTLPAAEDMLPLAIQAFNADRTVAVEQAEPVYLRNEVTWKKLPGKE